MEHEHNWQPGTVGKGLVSNDGVVHTWSTDSEQQPYHYDYMEENGIGGFRSAFYIDPDGAASPYLHDPIHPEDRDLIMQHTDLFIDEDHVGEESDEIEDWEFDASVKLSKHQLNWEEGWSGKGIIDNKGNVHTWESEDFLYHEEYMRSRNIPNARAYFYIEDDGGVHNAGMGRDVSAYIDELRDADPRLYLMQDRESGWTFE